MTLETKNQSGPNSGGNSQAEKARHYLALAASTDTGKQALRAIGLGAIIAAPTNGDDFSTIKAAAMLRVKLRQSYGI